MSTRASSRPERTLVLAALGSNLGDASSNVRAAVDQLQTVADGPILRSSLWRRAPVTWPPDSSNFINAAVAFVPKASVTAESLLRFFKQLERYFGRRPKRVLNEARPLDVDLIAFVKEVRATP